MVRCGGNRLGLTREAAGRLGMCGPASRADSGRGPVGDVRAGEWAVLGEWLGSPPEWPQVDLGVLRDCLGFVGRARASLAALEADVVAEVARREGDAATEEILRRDQKQSRRGARKAVRTAAQLEWAPNVAAKLADGSITPEAAGLILDADSETGVDQHKLLAAAEEEPDDVFRRTLKDHVNERATEQELEARRAAQRRRRRASVSEQSDGMFHLFAQFDPLTGARVQAALIAKSDELFRDEDSKDRPTPPQRFADALADLVCTNDAAGAPAGTELIVLADYDSVLDEITNTRLADGIRLTEAETLAAACDAKILPGIFNKHTANVVLGRSQRKVPPRLRKQLIARDGGCVGCVAHHKICEVHHIKHWKHGGETTLENTCLLCWRCHHVRVHQNGEEITRHPGGTLTLAPPANPPPGPAGPPADDQIDRREPRGRRCPAQAAIPRPPERHRQRRRDRPAGQPPGTPHEGGDPRHEPPPIPTTNPASPTTLPFPDPKTVTAPHAED